MTKPVGAARPLKAEPPPFPPPAPLPSARDAGRATRGGARRQARAAVGWAGGACRVAVVMGRKWLLRRAPFSNRRRGRAGPGLLPQNRPLPMRSDRGERALARLPLGSLFLRALPMPRWHVSASPPWFALEEFTFSSVSVRLSRREAGEERSKGWAGGRRAGRWPRGVRVPLCAYTAWCLVARRLFVFVNAVAIGGAGCWLGWAQAVLKLHCRSYMRFVSLENPVFLMERLLKALWRDKLKACC